MDSKGPDPELRKGPDAGLYRGPQLTAAGPEAAFARGPGRIRIHGPSPLLHVGPGVAADAAAARNTFKQRKDEENRARKDAANTAPPQCHIEVVDEAVWNERQGGGVCNTLMQALCTRQTHVKETAM